MKARLATLYFLQFAVWGCYLSTLGQFLGSAGLGKDIAWFYAAIGIVSILTPALMGHIADRYIKPARLLAFCHLAAAIIMLVSWIYAVRNTEMKFSVFYPLYLAFLAFYMPTMALANTTSFGIIKRNGKEPVDLFPSIRIWGTIGFILAMWMVNSTYVHDGTIGWTLSEAHPYANLRFQYNSMQLFCAGAFGVLTGLYALTLPTHAAATQKKQESGAFSIFRLSVLSEFFLTKSEKARRSTLLSKTGVFLIFVAFIGVCMQISNGYATPFISHFMGMPEYAGSFAGSNATVLFSLSQISEAFFILLVGKSLKRWGIGIVFGAGILAWSLRFLLFGVGNPDDGLIFLILSMIIYGIAFNFITIAGHLHMERVSPENHKGLGQGVMMLMSNGIGSTAGIIVAGEVINHWCSWEMVPMADGTTMRLFMGDWTAPWMIFAGYTALLLTGWILFTCTKKKFKHILSV